MFVELGNADAIEGYREDGSDEVKHRPLEGQQITTFHFPEGLTVSSAFREVVNTVGHHFGDGGAPVWVHSDSESLKSLLEEEFTVKKQKPAKWGNYKSHETPGVVAHERAAKAAEKDADQ